MYKNNKIRFQWYDNSVDMYNPEIWARTSLELLYENMVLGNRVYREFDTAVADEGDVVNTRMPAQFVAKRKTDSDEVTVQDATAVNVPVQLNQHLHTSFTLKDRQMSLGMPILVNDFLAPAVISISQAIDKILSTQVYQFLPNICGHLGGISNTNAKDYMLAARQVAFNNKMPANRDLIWTGTSETAALGQDLFVSAEKVGDDGTALREGSLGRKYGFNNFATQNQPEITSAMDTVIGAVDNASGEAAGATDIEVDGFAAAITNGTWFTVAGDDIPHQVTGTTGGATPTNIEFTPALKRAVADDAVVTIVDPGAVNKSGGYSAGYAKEIVVDGFTLAPQVGQGVSFGSSTAVYGIIDVTSNTGITLDRPLEADIANDATVNLLPAGSYNFGLDRGAIALVNRPLDLAPAEMGVRCYVASAYGVAIRVTMTYEGRKQGILFTVDTLCGVATLNQARGLVMCG